MKKKNHFRFNSKKAKKNFFNKKVNDLTVGETLAYGATCSVVALAVSLIPLAVIGIKEKMENKADPVELWKEAVLTTKTEDEDDAVEKV